jgi:septal ring factor EnvC (AmiA/AmiB activator)
MVPEQSALAYYQWLRSASTDAAATELRLLRAQARPQPLRDVKLALLTSLSAESDVDTQNEAARVLTEAVRLGGISLPEDYRLLAAYWIDVLAQRAELRKLQVQLQQSAAALETLKQERAALEQSYAVQTETVNSLQSQKALLEQHNRVMQKQIDALTAIEQQLVEQDQRNKP